MLDESRTFSWYIIGAPEFVNDEFVERWIFKAGARAITLDLGGARAVYVLNEWRVFSYYIIGAPDFVNAAFVARWVILDPSAPPATPSGLMATKVDIPFAPDDVWVSWNPVPGTASYEVYHSRGDTFGFEALVEVPGFLDEDPVFLGPDWYVVRACNASGCSDFSTSAMEGEQGFIASLLAALPELGLDSSAVCTRLLSSGVTWLLAQVASFLMPVASLIGSLLADELDCR